MTFAHFYGIVGCYWRAVITVHGGMKVYRGAAAAARHYVEADRSRADDYYLAEGTGIAERYVAHHDGARHACGAAVRRRLRGVGRWAHPESGVPKGRLAQRREGGSVRRGRR